MVAGKGHQVANARKSYALSQRGLRGRRKRCSMRRLYFAREALLIGNILTGVVAAIHVYIVILEMVLWDTPRGRKAFGMTAEFSASTKVLAANQGLYNGFLVAGLVWGLWLGDAGFAIKAFFLGCVIVAGLFGAATASIRILYIQALPAVLALIALLLGV